MVAVIREEKRELLPREIGSAAFQVERERKYARHILTIDDAGNVIDLMENQHPQLDVLAVIGPAHVGETFLEETILLEIGYKKVRPYNKTGGIENGSKKRQVWSRARFAPLDGERFVRAFPTIQSILTERTKEIMAGWRIRRFKMPWSTLGNSGEMVRTKGVRYSVSLDDHAMLSTVLKSERTFRQLDVEFDMQKSAARVRKLLRSYKNLYPSEKQWKLMLTFPNVAELIEWLNLRGFRPHHYYMVHQLLVDFPNRILFERVMEHMGVSLEEMFEWGELIHLESTPIFEGMYVRCMPNTWVKKEYWSRELKRWRITKNKPNYLSFELAINNEGEKEEASTIVPQPIDPQWDDDIPF